APVSSDGSTLDQSVTRGRDGLKQRVLMFRSAFPDIKFMIRDMVAEDDRVSVRYVFTGTHLGEFAGIAPTDRRASVPGQLAARIADGQIQEAWSNFDASDLLGAIGVNG